MAIPGPGIRHVVMVVVFAAIVALTGSALAGCGSVNQEPKTSPTAAPTSAAEQPTTPPSAAPTTAPATAPATGHTGKPSIDTLQSALVGYFHDKQDLSTEKAKRAAACAVYPSFQELSARSLAAIVRHDPTGIDPGDKEVFGDVTTECVTAAG